jgi:CRISPR/Cas system-associated exonuclease Cas4 (RecB family)
MNSFLENICIKILSEHSDLSEVCIVFPSRRAGLYFKSELGKKLSCPVWSPSVYSIEDFVEELSGYTFADELQLLYELFSVYVDVYQKEIKALQSVNDAGDDEYAESFDTFFPWGEMLLKDFDTVDKYLVDAEVLFRRIRDLKEIEESFPIELQEAFKKFWGSLFDSDNSYVKENFLKIWQILSKLYIAFTEVLKKKKICYEGMAYKELFLELRENRTDIIWNKIIFAGFNSLSTSEKKIIGLLKEKGIAELYWDGDEYYIKDEKQEAGYFIRKNLKLFEQENCNFDNCLTANDKNIYSVGASSAASMVKAFGSELKKLSLEKDFNAEKTAVIIPEENLLLPVLYSVPEEIKEINVTMGLQLTDTPVYSLINLLRELQNNCIFENGRYAFYHIDVERILLHPYLKYKDAGEIFEIIRLIRDKNILYFSLESYNGKKPEILGKIFKKIFVTTELEDYIKGIIDFISGGAEADKSADDKYKEFLLEYLYSFKTGFNRFNNVMKNLVKEISTDTYWRFLSDVFKRLRIPFVGEPLKGLQIMGLLETRNIDFDNIFFLSANEGVLPKGNSQNSFIPYSLRKALRMPTYDDEDSNTAYYFYRLLQKTRNVYLFYNSEIGNSVKEKSRYIYQIENELAKRNSNVNYKEKIFIPYLSDIKKKKIEIQKNDEIIEKIKSIKKFSPSTISKYISCSLKFYFEKIAGVKERKEVEEYFDSRLVGNVLHKLLEQIYKPFEGKVINSKILEKISSDLFSNFEKVLEKAVLECESTFVLKEYGGKNILFGGIILQLLKRVLENEKKLVPFKIVSIEEEITNSVQIDINGINKSIGIYGRIDRVDEKDNIIRVIDYKTGSFTIRKKVLEDYEKFFSQIFSNPDYKEYFQSFYYGYLSYKNDINSRINICLYPVKKLENGILNLSESFIEENYFSTFEDYLKKLFVEMYNKEIPFKQTEDETRCTYCPYSEFCYRDLKNTI